MARHNGHQTAHARSTRARPAFVLILALGGLVAGLGLAELGLRAAAWFTPPPTMEPSRYQQAEGYYTYRPSTAFDFVNEAGERVVTSVDERGLRNPPGAFAGAEVLLMGDSFIAAVNTPVGDTLAARLSALGLRTYNAGVDGTSSFQQLRLLRWLAPHFRGRVVVLGFYLGNDFRDNYWERPISGDTTGGGDALDPRMARFCRLSVVCQVLHDKLVVGHLQGQATDPMGSFALSEMLLLRNRSREADIARDNTREALLALSKLTRERGLLLIVAGIPSKASVLASFREISMFTEDARARDFALKTSRLGYSWNKPDSDLAAICAELEIRYVSLLQPFRSSLSERLFYDFDAHWTAAGQARAAELIAPVVRRSLQEWNN